LYGRRSVSYQKTETDSIPLMRTRRTDRDHSISSSLWGAGARAGRRAAWRADSLRPRAIRKASLFACHYALEPYPPILAVAFTPSWPLQSSPPFDRIGRRVEQSIVVRAVAQRVQLKSVNRAESPAGGTRTGGKTLKSFPETE
jgi:hypothetical protein